MIRIAPCRILLLSAGMIGLAACAATSAVDKLQVGGEPKAMAECTMQALQRANFCNSAFEQFGITISSRDSASRLLCYRIPSEPPPKPALSYEPMISAILIGTDAADETKGDDPWMTVQFTPIAPQLLDAAIWVEPGGDAEAERKTIGLVEAAIHDCGGGPLR